MQFYSKLALRVLLLLQLHRILVLVLVLRLELALDRELVQEVDLELDRLPKLVLDQLLDPSMYALTSSFTAYNIF